MSFAKNRRTSSAKHFAYMPDIIETLQNTTRLVKVWGESPLRDGRTLSQALTLNEIPFWEAFAVEMARIYVPLALHANSTPAELIKKIIRPHLNRIKFSLRDLIYNRRNTNGCSSWPDNRTVLCLDFSEHISKDVLQPVAKRLAQHTGIKVVSLRDKSWENASSHQNGLYQTVWEHWSPTVRKEILEIKLALSRIYRDVRRSNTLANIIRDGDILMWDQLKDVFNSYFHTYLPFLIPQAVIAQHILKNHRPTLVISPDLADPRTRFYTLLCRQMGIPCMDIQFGPTGDEGIEWQFLASDKVAAWGETSKQAMLKHGIPEEKIIVTGSPRHDMLVNATSEEVMSIRTKLGIPEKSAMILLASAYQLNAYNEYSNPEILQLMKRSVFEATDKTQGICLVVKPHPSEDVRETQELAGKNRNIVFVSQKSDIRELTRVCDAFVSFGSTATADALISGKLVICPVFPEWIWSDLFKNTGATLVPTSAEEVLETFQLVALGKHENSKVKLETARQDFLANWVFRTDGMATNRVVKLALKLAGIRRT
jgi:hypothetical protein